MNHQFLHFMSAPILLSTLTSSLLMYSKITCAQSPKADALAVDSLEVIEVTNSHDFLQSNYQILQRKDFINSSTNLSDVLSDVNGIQIRQISGLGNPVSISIRGSSAKQVQFFIDGQLVNDSQFGSFDLNQIPTEQIQSIEISKNQAMGTGSTPIGGVIRINTYNPEQDTFKLSAGVGSFGYQEFNALKNIAFKHHNLAFGGNYLASDNDYEYTVPQSFDNPNETIKEPLKNNEFEKISLFINDNLRFNNHQIKLNVTYNQQDKALANYQNNSPENQSNIALDTMRYGVQYNWLSELSYLDDIEIDIYQDNKNEDYQDKPNIHQNTRSIYQTDKRFLGLKPNISYREVSLNPFITFSQQEFTSNSTRNAKPIICNGISSCDVKATQEQLNWGARITWQNNDLFPFNSYLLASQLDEKNENIVLNQTSPDLEKNSASYDTQEVGINLGESAFRTSLNWSKGIRTPTLYELFGDRGAFKGNDNLLPEKADTYTLSAKYQDHALSIPFNLSAAIYQQTLENSIVAIFNSAGTGSYSNVSDADLIGFELQASSQLTELVTFSIQAHVIDSNTKSSFTAFDDKKLPGIYHQQYSASFSYQMSSKWRLSVITNLDQELYFNRSNQFETNSTQNKSGTPADRFVTDLSLHWQHNKYHANFSVTNLFDDIYQDLANRPAQGRSIQLKLSIEEI